MSILDILGRLWARAFCLDDCSLFFSSYACLSLAMPVASIKAGSWKALFSMPRLPCRYLRLLHQWRGTGTELRYDLRYTSSLGSDAVTSHTSTTSGRFTSCLSSEMESRFNSLNFLRLSLSFFFSPSSSSESSASFATGFLTSSAEGASAPSASASAAVSFGPFWKCSKILLHSLKLGSLWSTMLSATYSISTPRSAAVASAGALAAAPAPLSLVPPPAAFFAFFFSFFFLFLLLL
mmetsp:Transcript_9712/g.22680  ORF Transcript_9712/g.22680 Transcript_9712/m.22680 type:complete len:236 (-) Transcript_9712:133-840(-)